ncbi:unnamed protein product [Rhizoctonia solani]|uniref:Uncharacterized protein n=1 Tax=Rhizoctonia solani TaxID=456999 RepID=A0A8H3AY47_9AGAM|nr:unnamed protein product [Rhizoctonia solani]
MTTKNNYLPFFAAEYENRRVSIRRAADYDDTISCIQRAFPKLSEIAANRISIAQVFLELGNGMVEINRDTWKDALPWLRTVRVLISEVTPESTVSKKRKVVEAGPSTPSSSSVPHRAEGPTGGFAAQSATNTAANSIARARNRYGLRKVSTMIVTSDGLVSDGDSEYTP